MTLLAALWLLNSPSLLEDVEGLDRKLKAAEQALGEAVQELSGLREETSRRQGELAEARLRHREIMKTYRARIRALAKMPTGARLVMLGRSTSMRDYLRTSKLLRRIAVADRRIAKARQDEEAAIAVLEAEAIAREQRAKELEAFLRSQRDQLANLRGEKLAFISAITHDPNVSQQLRAEASRAHAALTTRVRSLKPAGSLRERFSANQRRLPWPAPGSVAATFGATLEPAYGTQLKHAGVDIAARAGTTVQAVASGKVVYADWMRGYGQLVIVDHGEQFHSLYAHLGRIDVSADVQVRAGSRLGTVGDTGSMRGTVLYFEIRRSGTALDPTDWLRPD